MRHVRTQTCENVGANQPGQRGDTETGQQREGVQGQQMENNELEDIWPNYQKIFRVMTNK